MRVTDRMIFDSARTNTGKAAAEAAEASERASTGLRVVHPGDDPVAASRIAVHQASLRRLKSVKDTAARATEELNATDAALGAVGGILTRANELGVQLANATYSDADRQGGASEVAGLFRDAIASLNVQVAGRYVLAGFRDDTPPFDDTGAYNGDVGVRRINLGPGAVQDVSIRADEAVKGTAGGVDVLRTLQALADAMANNDVAGIRSALEPLQQGIEQISVARGSVGASAAVLGSAVTVADEVILSETEAMAKAREVDVVDAATQLASAQRAFEAALSASAKSFQLTLMDKLR